MSIITNPVVVSVLVLTALCLLKFNILLGLIISAIVGGLLGGIPLAVIKPDSILGFLGNLPFFATEGKGVVDILIGGMGGNSATALAYILLGIFAIGLARSGLGNILSKKLSKVLGGKKLTMLFTIAAVGCLSQNLIPIHIAYMPIVIPPLLGLMNKMKLDRRAMAVALTFSVKAPYIVIPAGFGLIFQEIIANQVNANGLNVTVADVTAVNWIGGLSMLIGLIVMVLYFASKDREYEDLPIIGAEAVEENPTMNRASWAALAGAVATAITSIATESLPLSALFGVIIMLIFGGIKFNELDDVVNGGIGMMGFIAFVMLVAAGYGAVLSATGAVESLVEASAAAMGNSKIVSAFVMLLIGLLVTMGIGSSFSTIPIIATIFVPLGLKVGFSSSSIILLVALAGALGDAGSPASDSTLGPTSALNADGQHDHIWDTCVPTFIAFNIPLIIGGVVGTMILG